MKSRAERTADVVAAIAIVGGVVSVFTLLVAEVWDFSDAVRWSWTGLLTAIALLLLDLFLYFSYFEKRKNKAKEKVS